MLGGRDRVSARRVHDHDAAFRGGLDVDVVDAHASAADDLQARRGGQRLRGHLRRAANDQRVEFANAGDEFVFFQASAGLDMEMGAFREDSDASGGDAVSGQYAVISHPAIFEEASSNVKHGRRIIGSSPLFPKRTDSVCSRAIWNLPS